jgi:hypothetical protein
MADETQQRDDAAYEEVIQQSTVQGSQEIWARLRDSWGRRKAAAGGHRVPRPAA